ncbi:MAG: dihydrofolate reductase [Planctomycetes bacterium]|nr:dihydrofolate reductase [Planctomycetota bacterium]
MTADAPTENGGPRTEHALPPLALVAAMSLNRVIGRLGELPWHEPEDLRHFRDLTVGHAVIMGRKTFDVLGKPLPRRRNLIITRKPDWTSEGCEVFADLASAIAAARTTDAEPRIIGGGEIYAQALPLATIIHLTVIGIQVEGDAFFPELDDKVWRERERRGSGHLAFRTLERVGTGS